MNTRLNKYKECTNWRKLVIKRFGLFLIALLSISDAHAICISPVITPTECDFKNEDTHLWGNQPGLYFAKEDRVEELIRQGESFVENYYASVKTTGDMATRFMIAPTAAAMAVIEVQQGIHSATLLANDPYSLKGIYTDLVCDFYWTAVEQFNGIERDCPATPELLTDLRKLQRLDEVRQEITDIVLNPDLVLGEQWSESIAEIIALRARLQSPDTFARTRPEPAMERFFDERYPSLTALIATPHETFTQSRIRVGELNTSRRNTIREHMMATHQHHLSLRGADQRELVRLSRMSGRAVGRMQSIEIDNMLAMQDVQNKQMIAEEIMNINTLYLQDMADTHTMKTRRRVFTTKSATPIPLHEVILGNGEVFTQ